MIVVLAFFFKGYSSKGEIRGAAPARSSRGPVLTLVRITWEFSRYALYHWHPRGHRGTVHTLCRRPRETSLKWFLEFWPQKNNSLHSIPSSFTFLYSTSRALVFFFFLFCFEMSLLLIFSFYNKSIFSCQAWWHMPILQHQGAEAKESQA